MPKYAILNRRDHAARTWKRPDSYRFAERDQVVALVGQEAAAACCEMPFGFVRHADGLEMAALCAFTPGDNVFIAPNGQWMMRYIPMTLRGHPFHHVRQPGSEQAILCIDEDSESLKGGSETFFKEDGSPTPPVQEAMQLQLFLDAARTMTRAAIAALARANVLIPWEITGLVDKEVRPVVGFLRVDKGALDKVDDATHLELRKANALEIAYHQLASMNQIPTVERLTEMKEGFRKTGGGAATSDQVAAFLSGDKLIF